MASLEDQHSGREKDPEPIDKPHSAIEIGTQVLSENNTFTIVSILGSGGFGDVFKVKDKVGKEWAMKTEVVLKKKSPMDRLKLDSNVLSAINALPDPTKKLHFVGIEDKGHNSRFKFIVMSLVGKSLYDKRKSIGEFGPTTAIKICLQSLESVVILHSIGYLHRDIKPQNFAVGLPPTDGIIYMLDFGIARKFVDSRGIVRVPRKEVKFIGTVKFAARATHLKKEQCRRDDLESWLYMCIDICHSSNLSWRCIVDKRLVLSYKNQFFSPMKQPWKEVPEIEFCSIKDYVNSLSYTDEPDYKYIADVLETLLTKLPDGPMDWQSQPSESSNSSVPEDERGERAEKGKDGEDKPRRAPTPVARSPRIRPSRSNKTTMQQEKSDTNQQRAKEVNTTHQAVMPGGGTLRQRKKGSPKSKEMHVKEELERSGGTSGRQQQKSNKKTPPPVVQTLPPTAMSPTLTQKTQSDPHSRMVPAAPARVSLSLRQRMRNLLRMD